jgi:TonB family protein
LKCQTEEAKVVTEEIVNIHYAALRQSCVLAAVGVVVLAMAIDASAKTKPKFDLPKELSHLSASARPKPPRTVLDFDSTSKAIADTAVAVVWLRFKSGGVGEFHDIEVAFSSHPGYGLEERAIQALKAASFEPKSISGKKADKWLYYEVAFDRTFFRNNTTPLKDWSPDIDSTEYMPPPDEFIPVEVVPEMIEYGRPEYPRSARSAGITGTVWVKCLIDRMGHVREVVVGKTAGYAELDSAAVISAYKSRFKPGIQKGQPVACWVIYRVDFKLEH